MIWGERTQTHSFVCSFLHSAGANFTQLGDDEGLQEQVQSVLSLDVISLLGGSETTGPLFSELVPLTVMSP